MWRYRDTVLVILVLCIASLQLLGLVLDNKTIRGLGFLSAASPLPFVFSSHDGLETFAQKFAVIYHFAGSKEGKRVEMTPKMYARLGGSYNRRNVYGAIFSHGPVLAPKGFGAVIDSVAKYGFCYGGPLFKLSGEQNRPISISLESIPADQTKPMWRRKVACR